MEDIWLLLRSILITLIYWCSAEKGYPIPNRLSKLLNIQYEHFFPNLTTHYVKHLGVVNIEHYQIQSVRSVCVLYVRMIGPMMTYVFTQWISILQEGGAPLMFTKEDIFNELMASNGRMLNSQLVLRFARYLKNPATKEGIQFTSIFRACKQCSQPALSI